MLGRFSAAEIAPAPRPSDVLHSMPMAEEEWTFWPSMEASRQI